MDADAGAAGRRRFFHVAEARKRGHREGEAVIEKEGKLARPHAPEDEDGLPDAEAAQGDPFLDEGDPEGIGVGVEAAGHGQESVAVGVGLEDRHDPGGGHVFLHGEEIGAQPGEADHRIRGSEPSLFGGQGGAQVRGRHQTGGTIQGST